MLKKIFTVYDSKSQVFGNLIIEITTASGQRVFTDAVNQEESAFARHAGDYTLFEIGTWNDTTGEIIPTTHNNLGTALTYIQGHQAKMERQFAEENTHTEEEQDYEDQRNLSNIRNG